MKDRVLGLGLVLAVLAASGTADAQGGCARTETDTLRTICHEARADARADLAAAAPQWQWVGLVDEAIPDAGVLVLERHGLRLAGHGCIVTPEVEAYVDGYNGVIADHFGAALPDGFLGRAVDDARARLPGTQPTNAEVVRGLQAPAGACAGSERCFVVVRFDIAPSGEPTDAVVLRSSDPVLDAVALAAAVRLRFPPAVDLANGQPLRSLAFPIRFSLD